MADCDNNEPIPRAHNEPGDDDNNDDTVTQSVHPVKKKNKPHNSAFKQQRLRAWQPILTTRSVLITFGIIGPVFVGIGIGCLLASESVVEASARYDDICYDKLLSWDPTVYNTLQSWERVCNVTIDVKSKMESPVYMYYELDNYYQNHRRYVKSRNDAQLRGDDDVEASDAEDCAPLIETDDITNDPRTAQNTGSVLNPCGLVAWSVFNDTFSLCKTRDCTEQYNLKRSNIAWKSDKDTKFDEKGTWISKIKDEEGNTLFPGGVENEDFIVWMRTAGLPRFRKLYRRLEEDLPKGEYTIQLRNRYDVKKFSGKKRIVLSTNSWLGGKNPFLGAAYITVGTIITLLGCLFFVKDRVSPRKMGELATKTHDSG